MSLAGTLVRQLNDPIQDILDEIAAQSYAFLHLTDNANSLAGKSLLQVAHKDVAIKEIVTNLARVGYYVYHQADETVRFVQEKHIPKLWHSIRDGNYQTSPEGVVYSFHEPIMGGRARNLVVVFSSIGADIFGAGLSRYFTQNFQSIQKHLPADTAVLRIADIGGVVGSFYLDTDYAPENTRRIALLIDNIRKNLGLEKSSVITYGASKGATGAFFHALKNGYKCVCVEPILNDHHYETKFGDTHFTADGLFSEKKEETFAKLLKQHQTDSLSSSGTPDVKIVVVYSEQSAQSTYIRDILGSRLTADMSIVNFRHPLISDHPDVSPKSINLISMYLNMMCYGFPIISGVHFSLECYPPESVVPTF